MPAFHLPADQIQDIAAFLRSRQQAAIDRNAYTILNVVTGDREKGREYFNGAGRCHTCHSPTGDLAGIAKNTTPLRCNRVSYIRGRARRSRLVRHRSPSRWPVRTVRSPARSNISTTSMSPCATPPANIIPSPRDARLKVEVHDPLAAHAELLKKYTDADMHNLLAYLVTLK
jgi:cytochrome c oxidase cbb3-type subunit 3